VENEGKLMAYLAGVMDGDGSFCITKLGGQKCNPLYYPLLQCSTWRTFVHRLKDTFGGTIITGKPHICQDGSEGKALFKWKLRSLNNVKPVLEKLIPYLQIKKDRAQCLLDFINDNPFIRGKELTKESLLLRERYSLKMIQYNDWTSCSRNVSKKLARVINDDPIIWSYLAGLIDTDGSFCVKKQVQNKGTDVKNPRYVGFIQITMTDMRAINFLRENVPFGRLCIPKNNCTNSGDHFQFSIHKKEECIQFLKLIIPYLYSKKENAEVMLKFCENSQTTKYCKAGIPEEELKFREECHQKIKQLNKYGIYKPTLIDLEARRGDRAEGESHRERLSERAQK
jgi:hypothetical protein